MNVTHDDTPPGQPGNGLRLHLGKGIGEERSVLTSWAIAG
jgi:hypothetical protein